MSDQRLGRPRTITRDIEQFLAEATQTEWSPTQLWQRMTQAGMDYSPEAVGVAMTRMLHRGELERVSHGTYKMIGAERVPIEFTELIMRQPHGLSLHHCGECAGVTTDTEQHARWHEEQR